MNFITRKHKEKFSNVPLSLIKFTFMFHYTSELDHLPQPTYNQTQKINKKITFEIQFRSMQVN